jgi:hypothetical protein
MSMNEYVADYLDRHGVIGFPTKKMVEKAREEWRELQDDLFQYEADESYTELCAAML